jgi:hypothetical protein
VIAPVICKFDGPIEEALLIQQIPLRRVIFMGGAIGRTSRQNDKNVLGKPAEDR